MGNCQKQEQEQGNENMINDQLGPVNQIRITNYTWVQDYQGLFDFDAKQVTQDTIKAKGNVILMKKLKNYQLLSDNMQDLNEDQLKNCQFRLIQKDQYYQICPIFIQNQNSNITIPKLMWAVVQSLPQQSHIIQQKDIIKLGKQKIRVRQIALFDSNYTNNNEIPKLTKAVYQNLAYQQTQSKIDKQKQKQSKQNTKQLKPALSDITNSQQVCRICLDPGQMDNPLITPCKCMGSVKYIHLTCLRQWLAKRLNVIKSQHCITINWMQLSCQMCKAPFKYRIYMDNKKFYTVDIPKPPKPYIILQLMIRSSSSNGKIFHFISFAHKNKILLGRRKDIDVRISQDISISRTHACIEYKSDLKQFVISDNKSKFGTLVLIKKGLLIRPKYKDISLQIGAEIYSFNSKRGPSKNNYKINENQNDINQYFADNLSGDEEEDIQQNQDDQLNSMENQNMQNPSGHTLQSAVILLPRHSSSGTQQIN